MLNKLTFILHAQKYKIFTFFIASLVVTVLVIIIRQPMYESTATVLIKAGREIVFSPQDKAALSVGGIPSFPKRSEDIKAEEDILESRHLIEAVVREVGIEKILSIKTTPAPTLVDAVVDSPFVNNLVDGIGSINEMLRAKLRDRLADAKSDYSDSAIFAKAVRAMEANLKVELLSRSDSIKVTYTSPDPLISKLVVSTLMDKYLDRHISVHQGKDMTEFFGANERRFKEESERLSIELVKVKNDNDFFLLDTQREELLSLIGGLRRNLDSESASAFRLSSKVKRFSEQLARHSKILESLDPSDDDPLIDTLNEQLAAVKVKRSQLLARYSENSRSATNLDLEIDEIDELLKAEYEKILLTNQNKLKVSESILSMLETRKRRYLERLAELNKTESVVTLAARTQEIANQAYGSYVTKREQARIDAELDRARVTNVRLLQPPSVSYTPAGASNALLFVISMAMSLIAGVVIAFIYELFDHTFRTSDDVEEYLGVQVLGVIRET